MNPAKNDYQNHKLTSDYKTASQMSLLGYRTDCVNQYNEKQKKYDKTENKLAWNDIYLPAISQTVRPIIEAVLQKNDFNTKEKIYQGLLCAKVIRHVINTNKGMEWSVQSNNKRSPEKTDYPWIKDPIIKGIANKATSFLQFPKFAETVYPAYITELEKSPFDKNNHALSFQHLLESSLKDLGNDSLVIMNEHAKNQDPETIMPSNYKRETEKLFISYYPVHNAMSTIKKELKDIQQEIDDCTSILKNLDIDPTGINQENLLQKIDEIVKKNPAAADAIKQLAPLMVVSKESSEAVKEHDDLIKQMKNLDINTNPFYQTFVAAESMLVKEKINWSAVLEKVYEIAKKCFQVYPYIICEAEQFDQLASLERLLSLIKDGITPEITVSHNNSIAAWQFVDAKYQKSSGNTLNLLAKSMEETEDAFTRLKNADTLSINYAAEKPVFEALITAIEKNDDESFNSFQKQIETHKPKNTKLLDTRPVRGYSLLHLAIFYGFEKAVQFLIKQGGNVLVQTKGKNILHIPVKAGVDCVCLPAAMGDNENLKTAIDAIAAKAPNSGDNLKKALTNDEIVVKKGFNAIPQKKTNSNDGLKKSSTNNEIFIKKGGNTIPQQTPFGDVLKKALNCAIVPGNAIDTTHCEFNNFKEALHEKWKNGTVDCVKTLLEKNVDCREAWFLNLAQIKHACATNDIDGVLEIHLKIDGELDKHIGEADVIEADKEILKQVLQVIDNYLDQASAESTNELLKELRGSISQRINSFVMSTTPIRKITRTKTNKDGTFKRLASFGTGSASTSPAQTPTSTPTNSPSSTPRSLPDITYEPNERLDHYLMGGSYGPY
jgi:hypothetical protein